ncbi:plancitoxin-1 [Sarcoptes scabiei]|nr:plancitoxin-1 [Sarcoptes scabiei]
MDGLIFLFDLKCLLFTSLIMFNLLDFGSQSTTNPKNCLIQRANLGENDFVPECTDDGHFKPIQCDNKTGYCFCVDPNTGRPNSQTTTRNRNPDCHLNRKLFSQSSSDVNPRTFGSHPTESSIGHQKILQSRNQDLSSEIFPFRKSPQRRSNACSVNQRINLLDKFISSIYHNHHKISSQSNSVVMLGIRRPSANNLGYNPLIRKFNEFDQNKDLSLSRGELQSMMTVFIENNTTNSSLRSSCSLSMFDFCDKNHDQTVTRIEYLQCLNLRLTKTLNDQYLLYRRKQRNERIQNRQQQTLDTTAAVSKDQFHQLFDSNNYETFPKSTIKSTNYHSLDELTQKKNILNSFYSTGSIPLTESSHHQQTRNKKNESRRDCLVIRSNLIESARVKSYGLKFVPECTSEGYYLPVQCHLMHCWCVSRVTGQPIKQLNKNSTKNLHSCDAMRKGCDQRRRLKFHSRLREQFVEHGFNCKTIFKQIDTETIDGLIGEQEFQKFFKQWNQRISINPRLRKCHKTEIHYCDQNDDGFLTLNEWNQCCNDNITMSISTNHINHLIHSVQSRLAQRESGLFSQTLSTSFAQAYNDKKNRPRLGPNPLKILKSE